LALLGLALGLQAAMARGIDHMRFNGPTTPETPRDEGLGGDSPPLQATAPDMTALMKFDFVQRSLPPVSALPDPGAIRLPTATLHIPSWMRPKRRVAIMPSMPAIAFAGGITGGGYDRCDGRLYTPAWWLDAKTEARRAYYFDTMAAIACEHGVPTSLLDAVIAKESRYKYWAISPKGAMGMMQIMPGTADQLGLANPFDAVSNIRAGARYLRAQLDRFGRADLALAAYNAGPHRRSLREGRLPMIGETLDYVQTILTNWSRLAPRTIEMASTDRAEAAAAAVATSPLRQVSFARYTAGQAGRF
jgi:hypothetical protein